MRHQEGTVRYFGFDAENHTDRFPDQPEISAELAQDLESKREALLEVPSRTDGLDIRSIDSFWNVQGLEVPPFVVIYREETPVIAEILREEDRLKNLGGKYNHWTDVAIVVRDPDTEAANGRGFTESMIVHEQAHGTSSYFDSTMKIDKSTGNYYHWFHRRGFATEGLHPRKMIGGEFFEEAYCDNQRLAYLASIGLSNGHLPPNIGMASLELLDDTEVLIPPKFASHTDKGGMTFLPSALAAYGFELMLDRMPGLMRLANRSRTDIAAIAKFAKTVNKIEPGLYSRLRKRDYTQEGFLAGLIDIINATDNQDLVIPKNSIPGAVRSTDIFRIR